MTPEKRLVFGQVPPKEATRRKSSHAAQARKEAPPLDPDAPYTIGKKLIEAVLKHKRQLDEGYRKLRSEEIVEATTAIYPEAELSKIEIFASTAASCLRWSGYQVLGESLGFKPRRREPKIALAALVGTAVHFEILRTIRSLRLGETEVDLSNEKEGLRAYADVLHFNRSLKEYQILDYKVIGPYVFSQFKKEKGKYPPKPEDRRQILLYLWLANQKFQENRRPKSGLIVYLNRGSEEIKEVVVHYDEDAQAEAEELVKTIRQARVQISQGKLPGPTVESSHVCQWFCPYCLQCDHGQKFAAGKVKKEQRRKPRWVAEKTKADREARQEKMEKMGLVQGKIPELDIPSTIKTSKVAI